MVSCYGRIHQSTMIYQAEGTLLFGAESEDRIACRATG